MISSPVSSNAVTTLRKCHFSVFRCGGIVTDESFACSQEPTTGGKSQYIWKFSQNPAHIMADSGEPLQSNQADSVDHQQSESVCYFFRKPTKNKNFRKMYI